MYSYNHACIDCGALFGSPSDLQTHIKHCPENVEPPTKITKSYTDDSESEDEEDQSRWAILEESKDDSESKLEEENLGWVNMLNLANKEYDNVFIEKVEQYEQHGYS